MNDDLKIWRAFAAAAAIGLLFYSIVCALICRAL